MSAAIPSMQLQLLQVQQQLAPLDPNQRYTIPEAIRYLRISRKTIYELIAAGELKTITTGARRVLDHTQEGKVSRSNLAGRKVASRRWVPGSEIARLSQVPTASAAA